MSRTGRFIELAHHGGCSKKLAAERLVDILGPIRDSGGEAGWPDTGSSNLNGYKLVSSVDVVLPMIDDPELFGRIVVAHVLSDIYASGARPIFADNILGVVEKPEFDGHDIAELDIAVKAILAGGAAALAAAGVDLHGGHSLETDQLLYGLSAVGVVEAGDGIGHSGAKPGDLLVLTKPLGTSIATKAWRSVGVGVGEFQDVVDGMLRLNQVASTAMLRVGATAATDVTGFGFVGHLRNLLLGSGVAGEVDYNALPIYESTLGHLDSEAGTRLLASNISFSEGDVSSSRALTPEEQVILYDAQVSGGLLAVLSADAVESFRAHLAAAGEEAWVVGTIRAGTPGAVTLKH